MNNDILIIKIIKISEINIKKEIFIIKNLDFELWKFIIKIYKKMKMKFQNY